MSAVTLTVNGERVGAEVAPRTHLADFLRDELRLTGTHLGCEHGVCGACTILLDGVPARSCIAYAAGCNGSEVQTIEGFDDDTLMAELREAFSREHALQCGFCTPGMLIAARDIVQRLPGADETRIRTELSGNLCRCTGYLGIVRAVKSVADRYPGGATVAAAAAQAVAAPVRFTIEETEPRAASTAAAATDPAGPRRGATRFEESFVIGRPPAVVWAALADFPQVANCLPGAELLEHDERSVKGRLNVKLGPISAAFAGSAVVQRDEAALTGTAKGAGSDTASRSRTRGDLTYRLAPEGDGATRVVVVVEYDLQGPLAQFSRSSLAQELGRRIVGEFAANLNARLVGEVPGRTTEAPPASLDAGRLLWTTLWQALKRLLGLAR
jgi:carbon-monoxide dehydrogenase small subunit